LMRRPKRTIASAERGRKAVMKKTRIGEEFASGKARGEREEGKRMGKGELERCSRDSKHLIRNHLYVNESNGKQNTQAAQEGTKC